MAPYLGAGGGGGVERGDVWRQAGLGWTKVRGKIDYKVRVRVKIDDKVRVRARARASAIGPRDRLGARTHRPWYMGGMCSSLVTH